MAKGNPVKFKYLSTGKYTEATGIQSQDIVFVKSEAAIYTHGQKFGLSAEEASKITDLESALSTLQTKVGGIKYFSTISDGKTTAEGTNTGAPLNFKGTGIAEVSVGAGGVTINVPQPAAQTNYTVTAGTAAGTIKQLGADIKVTGFDEVSNQANKGVTDAAAAAAAAEAAQTTADKGVADAAAAKQAADNAQVAADAAQATADNKIASVTGENAISVTTTNHASKVTLKLASEANAGNVTLTNGVNGLAANFTETPHEVVGVKNTDKVLSLGTDKLISSTIGLSYDRITKRINLTGKGNDVIAYIDAAAFIKDGMVSKAELITEAETPEVSDAPALPYIKITFNDDGGEPVRFSVKDLVDVYDGANLKLTAASDFAEGTSVDSAIKQLKAGVESATAAGVTSFAGKTGAITVDTVASVIAGSNAVKFTVGDDKKLTGTVTGLGNMAYETKENITKLIDEAKAAGTDAASALDAYKASNDAAVNAVKNTADSAVQSVRATNTGTYISVNAAKSGTTINLTPSVTTQAIDSASSTAKGLAEASDVKAYITNVLSWEEF